MINIGYDIESYPNVFTATFIDIRSGKGKTFECSPWRDDSQKLKKLVTALSQRPARMVGFNNFFYDYPVLHHLLTCGNSDTWRDGMQAARYAKGLSNKIINTPYHDRYSNTIWPNDQLVPQIDLFRIHHFDNPAKATSLKVLEFNMRSESVEDLPFDPNEPLDEAQTKVLREYNAHDVEQTVKFWHASKDMVEFREELSRKYDRDFMNHNDTKIGKDFFVMELEKAGVQCFRKVEGRRQPVQTKRQSIWLEDVVFNYVNFDRPEFDAVLEWIKNQKIRETKAVFTGIPEDDLGTLAQYSDLKKVKGNVANLNCIVDGFKFVFGTGGLHGSVDSTIVEADDEHDIIDLDVTSYYPSISIVNRVFPEHLSETFVDVYARLKADRVQYPKKSAENAMLKLALNGVFGDSNNRYSPFYDPKYTMTITVNGQLMLCMLAERLMRLHGVELVQANTDGVTIRAPKTVNMLVRAVCKQWCVETKLDLEEARYKRMFIRDVNNYIGEFEDGSLKRKGAYEYDRGWHQNQSALVVPRAAEACLVRGDSVRETIRGHNDPFDFMLRTKVPRNSRLMLESDDGARRIQNTTRYYISTDGGKLVKIMPPLPKKPGVERRIGIDKDWRVTEMNRMGEPESIDHSYYEQEAMKLVSPLLEGYLKEMF